ncbi:endonuclease/exonuclease/phosphatase family protein [candidate division KSB1 bacterium]|nr:endonuclease/exonuclease/phosphatase family protein [candidate division KSB1 bacterium]
MKPKLFTIAVAVALLFQIGCTKNQPFSSGSEALQTLQKPENQQLARASQQDAEDLTVMTRNIYVGADVDAVLAAQSPEQVPVLVAQAFQTLLATNFHERAQALADEIQRNRPHLIGLQEVSLIRTQSPGDAVVGGTTPAETVLFDYLAILMDALKQRGLCYKVAGQIANADVEVPMLVNTDPLAFDDVRLNDYDVVLARQDVEIIHVAQANYEARLEVPSLGAEIPRGFVAVKARINDETIRFVNTHLEPASIPELLPIQLGQAQELAAFLQNETLPIVLVGDLNTLAPTGKTYQFLQEEGFLDLWTLKSNRDEGEGYTSPHDADLRNTTVHLDQRIDLILAKTSDKLLKKDIVARVVGDELRDRTPSGLWPSDHAGVVACFKL